MKISGFTIVRNAVIMGYPILESIQSVLPLVDEFIVGLGPCEDATEAQILSLRSPKIKIIHTEWGKSKGPGLILSEKTNEALTHCNNDWCLYLQADEVLCETDYVTIQRAIDSYGDDSSVEGLLFDYIHFYASYNTIAVSRKWYRSEVRAVRRSSGIQSWKDAQGFRVGERKPKVKSSGARVFHYGWVKPPSQMGEKKKRLDQLWHGNAKDAENDRFQFRRFYGLKPYTGQHPQVMTEKIKSENFKFDPKMKLEDWTLEDVNCLLSDAWEKIFDYRIGEYKNYILIE